MSPNRPAVPLLAPCRAAVALAALVLVQSPPAWAACAPGDSNPITSGDPAAGPIIVLGGLGLLAVALAAGFIVYRRRLSA